MRQFSIRTWFYVLAGVTLAACKSDTPRNTFEVSGTISNSTVQKIYLEELPAGSEDGIIVDSSVLDKNGKYKLKTSAKEAFVFNLRLGQSRLPVAAVINDVPKMTLNIKLTSGSDQFADSYEVSGSPASQEMKDFMYIFNNNLQKIFLLNRNADSLRKIGAASDSTMAPIMTEWKAIAEDIRSSSINSLQKVTNPALFIFELGYYQFNANESGFGLEPIDIEEVIKLTDGAQLRFPSHEGLVAVKRTLDNRLAEIKKMSEAKWVGKPAPDFSLPDPNGKEIKLSSFKGKYVLVDFWASWCTPCRAENPNVVRAYNKFKDKNFTILGVSLDNPGEKDKWLKAISRDQLTWTQVSDLKGWESIVVPMFDFGQAGIPYNILVDPQGVIIAERLRGSGLEAKLTEVLK